MAATRVDTPSSRIPTELIRTSKPRRWAATSMPRLITSMKSRLSSSSSKGTSLPRRKTTPTTSLSWLERARAAPSGTKLSSRTARSTRIRVSARGLPWPLRTRETEAIETPARPATS